MYVSRSEGKWLHVSFKNDREELALREWLAENGFGLGWHSAPFDTQNACFHHDYYVLCLTSKQIFCSSLAGAQISFILKTPSFPVSEFIEKYENNALEVEDVKLPPDFPLLRAETLKENGIL